MGLGYIVRQSCFINLDFGNIMSLQISQAMVHSYMSDMLYCNSLQYIISSIWITLTIFQQNKNKVVSNGWIQLFCIIIKTHFYGYNKRNSIYNLTIIYILF